MPLGSVSDLRSLFKPSKSIGISDPVEEFETSKVRLISLDHCIC